MKHADIPAAILVTHSSKDVLGIRAFTPNGTFDISSDIFGKVHNLGDNTRVGIPVLGDLTSWLGRTVVLKDINGVLMSEEERVSAVLVKDISSDIRKSRSIIVWLAGKIERARVLSS